jgi:hypothetical protein
MKKKYLASEGQTKFASRHLWCQVNIRLASTNLLLLLDRLRVLLLEAELVANGPKKIPGGVALRSVAGTFNILI